MTAKQGDVSTAPEPDDISPAELREFLEGGGLEEAARPEFKEALRTRLWELLQKQ
jgi:hypothetical protein